MTELVSLSGRSFIVTGAARGIGLAIAGKFKALGARVAGWDLDLAALQAEPLFDDRQRADVTSQDETEAAFAASLEALGDIDGIIANAGINGPTKPLWEYSLDEWNQVIAVDLTGVFLSVQPVLRHLRERAARPEKTPGEQHRQNGRIIIISSIGGKEGNPGATPYGAAKAGLIGYAKGLAREVMPLPITVNCIAPAMTETELLDGMSADYIADRKQRMPMGRFCTPEEIAAMAAFVASPACSFTTGQVFDVSGGRATW